MVRHKVVHLHIWLVIRQTVVYAGEQQLSYLCKTSKKLSMTKVILQEKTSQHQDEGPSSDHPNETTQ